MSYPTLSLAETATRNKLKDLLEAPNSGRSYDMDLSNPGGWHNSFIQLIHDLVEQELARERRNTVMAELDIGEVAVE